MHLGQSVGGGSHLKECEVCEQWFSLEILVLAKVPALDEEFDLHALQDSLTECLDYIPHVRIRSHHDFLHLLVLRISAHVQKYTLADHYLDYTLSSFQKAQMIYNGVRLLQDLNDALRDTYSL